MKIQIKRVYDAPAGTDGLRVLVDRLWPRGLTKENAAIDIWPRILAPSTELRKWFGHDEARFAEFSRRYDCELAESGDAIDQLIASANDKTMTLLYAAKNTSFNNAAVLKAWLDDHLEAKKVR